MSGGPKGAKRPLGRPLDGGVGRHDGHTASAKTLGRLGPTMLALPVTLRQRTNAF